MNVLLVEDNQGDIELMKMAFRQKHLTSTLTVVYDGVEAMEYLTRQGKFSNVTLPNLIWLDLNIPRMDGRQLLEVIKQDKDLKAIPVVIFSSSDASKDIMDCYGLHANCYVLKPFNLDKYMEIIKNIEAYWGGVVQLAS